MKILTVVGARPQFVKAAVVSLALKKAGINEVLVHTGQHFDANMSAVFFEELGIPEPKYNLDIHGSSHAVMTGEMMMALEKCMMIEQPDWVLVFGDTNSTLAAAVTAKKLNISLAHVEAGLRSFNDHMPEEINRMVTDRLSDLLFCPTETAVTNLRKEGVVDSKIMLSGDVMYDAALIFGCDSNCNDSGIWAEPYVLATVHRQESTNDAEVLSQIFKALNVINQQIKVIMPVHPRTRALISKYNISTAISMIEPVGYVEMLKLLNGCNLVLTDSGGLQKEAYFCKKPCVTLRNETEWVELVSNGVNILAGTEKNNILNAFSAAQNMHKGFNQKFYGIGNASELIAQRFLDML